MGGRGSSSGASNAKSVVKFGNKTYKTLGGAKLSTPQRREGYGTSASKKRENALMSSLPEVNKLPRGWVVTSTGGSVPAGYALVSNNKSRFGGNRESALLKIEKAKKYIVGG